MLDPFLSHELAVGRDHRGQRVVLVRVERDIFHRRRLLSRLNTAEYLPRTRSPRRVGGAALTSHQRDSNPCLVTVTFSPAESHGSPQHPSRKADTTKTRKMKAPQTRKDVIVGGRESLPLLPSGKPPAVPENGCYVTYDRGSTKKRSTAGGSSCTRTASACDWSAATAATTRCASAHREGLHGGRPFHGAVTPRHFCVAAAVLVRGP